MNNEIPGNDTQNDGPKDTKKKIMEAAIQTMIIVILIAGGLWLVCGKSWQRNTGENAKATVDSEEELSADTEEDASENDVTVISELGKEELVIENGSIQQEIISGNFEHLEGEFTDGDTYSEYMTEWYSRRKEELEWQQLDLNGDGIEDLILQEKEEVGERGHHEIVAIFACDKDSASCVLLDMNDMTAYYFCGPAGELMYSASSYVPLVSCEPYTHCYYDKEWNLIKDYKLIIYYVYDVGEDSEYPEHAEEWRENHPDMAEHGVYFWKVTDAGEEALTQDEFTEMYETVTGLKLYSSFFH